MANTAKAAVSGDDSAKTPDAKFIVKQAAVLGAGTMGAGIAAHLANAGILTLLLDIAPNELTPEEEKKGLTLESPQVRNRIVNALFEASKKLKPAPFMLADNAKLIKTGNFTDDISKLKECDLVIEAVVENLDIKHKLFAEVEKNLKPGAVIASNTSGIPIDSIAEPFSDDFKQHFLGIHFFNPPRYMKLVEIIGGSKTSGEAACKIAGFLDQRLGKGVVPAKDRPNFIANRIHKVKPSGIRRFFGIAASMPDVISLGIGEPDDLVHGIGAGIDVFDCAVPTRLARHGMALAPRPDDRYRFDIRKAEFATDEGPLVEGCPCETCAAHSRAYVNYLSRAEELTGVRLLVMHNLAYLERLMSGARNAIEAGRYADYRDSILAGRAPWDAVSA